MNDGPAFKIIINGKEYRDLDSVPEEFRGLIQRQVSEALDKAAAGDGEVADEPGRNVIKKVFRFEKSFNITLGGTPDERPPESPAPGAGPGPQVESSAWVLWLLLAAGTLGALITFVLQHLRGQG